MSRNTLMLARYLAIIFLSLLLISNDFAAVPSEPITIKILGINDFHGQVSVGRKIAERPVGSAPVLAAYLKEGKFELADNVLLALSGDQVGASPPASGLLNHEPSILFFNSLANIYCHQAQLDPRCNIVATVGNHEFDRGVKMMMNLIHGANEPPTDHWIPLSTYPGAAYPYISANIVDAYTGKTLFKPYVIQEINGVKIAFIGAILKEAPYVILPKNIEGIKFLDEAKTINQYIPEMKAQGANVIVVLLHQGGDQVPYEGPTREQTQVTGPIIPIIEQLDDAVDVVMAGHFHKFLNAFIPNHNGKKILVTEAESYSTAYSEVTLLLDPKNHKIIKESARIITTYADQWPGNLPDDKVAKLIQFAEKKVEPIIKSEIGILKNNLYRQGNEAGESNLGNLIADGYKNIFKADISLVNPGGIRADLFSGKITWGNMYSVQPFSNIGLLMTLTGQDIYDVLEQQWRPISTIILQVAGLSYLYDMKKPFGNRIVAIYHNNQLLQREKVYKVATNEFLAGGGDGFTVMKKGKIIKVGDTDLQVAIKHIQSLPQPFSSEIEGRIKSV